MLNLRFESNIHTYIFTYKQRIPRMSRDPIGSNNQFLCFFGIEFTNPESFRDIAVLTIINPVFFLNSESKVGPSSCH